MVLAEISGGIIVNLIEAEELLDGYHLAYDHSRMGQIVQSDGTPIPTAAPSVHHVFDNTEGVDAWVYKDLATLKSERIDILMQNADAALKALIPPYTDGEVSTWPDQQAEARAWKAWDDGGQSGDEPGTPILDGMIVGDSNLTKSNLVSRIVSNSDAYLGACGDILGQRIGKADQIRAASSAAGCVAISAAITTPSISLTDK